MTEIYYDQSMEPIIVLDEEDELRKSLKERKRLVIVRPENEEKKQALEKPFQLKVVKNSKTIFVKADSKVSIIVLCWNHIKYTKILIDSIREHTDPEKYQLIVVDQGSHDETLTYLRNAVRQNDIVIYNVQNKGFSGGNNQAIKLAVHEYVLFLNNDCEIQKKGWLDLMINANNEAALVGGHCIKLEPNYEQKMFTYMGVGKESDSWSYVEGWCLFGKRELFLDLGGFDMKFNPAYSEDADMSFRVKRMGLDIKAIKVPIKHFGSKTSGDINRIFPDQSEKNNRQLFRKWIQGAGNEMGEVQELEEQKNPTKIKSLSNPKITTDERSPKILVKRRGARGDVLLLTPILRELKNKYPESFLVVETECPDVLVGNPNVDHIEQHITKLGDYDIVLKPRYEDEMSKNAIDTMARQCGVELKSKKIDIYLTADQIRWAKNKIDMSKRYIAFHTGRVWRTKEWPLDRFKEVASYFLNIGYDIIELGSKETLCMDIGNDCRGCSIKQTASLIRECMAFVGVDSVCAHIAKAVGTPAFVIYGSVDPATASSEGIEYPIWLDDLECRGCRGRTSAEWVECHKPEVYCLTGISPDMVIKTMETYIRENILRHKAA